MKYLVSRVAVLIIPLVGIFLLVYLYASPSVDMEVWLSGLVAEMQSDLAETRPIHTNQVELEEIQLGSVLNMITKVSVTKVLITRPPYMELGKCRFDYIWLEIESDFVWKAFCSDFGLVEYNSQLRGWNPTNHLTTTEEGPYSQALIDILLETMRPAP